MTVNGLPEEVLEKEDVKKVMAHFTERFGLLFKEIDDGVLPNVPLAEGLEGTFRPILRIQYANLIQLAFNEAYKKYVGDATMEFSKDGMSGLFNGGSK